MYDLISCSWAIKQTVSPRSTRLLGGFDPGKDEVNSFIHFCRQHIKVDFSQCYTVVKYQKKSSTEKKYTYTLHSYSLSHIFETSQVQT
jgi:hypothetical protein